MLRRELLVFAGQALLLAGCQGPPIGRAPSVNPAVDQFGLQLSTLNQLMTRGFEETLAIVADIGYQQVEFSAMGLMGREPERVKELLVENKLLAPVGRVSPKLPKGFFEQPKQQLRTAFMQLNSPDRFEDNVRYSLELAHFFGQKVINLPALLPASFADIKSVEANIDLLNRAGDICSAEGVLFGYHNHNWEFTPIPDAKGKAVVPYNLMLERTDPAKVTFQLDSYWVVKAGADWLSLLKNNPGRFASCHLKDIDIDGAMADVGEGEIDFNHYITKAKEAGARYFFVERDNPPDPLNTARKSFENLNEILQSA